MVPYEFVILVVFSYIGAYHCGKEKVVYLNNEQKRVCVEYEGSNPCEDPITIGQNDNMNTTRMVLSDDSADGGKVWDIVKKTTFYVGNPGENVMITMAEEFGDHLKVNKMCVFVRHSSKVTISTFVRKEDNFPKELVLLNEAFEIAAENRNKFTKICVSKTKFTYVKMVFKLDEQTPDGSVHIQRLQLDACETTIDVDDISDIKYPTVRAMTLRTPKTCTSLTSSDDDPSFFVFDDHDSEGDILAALKGSSKVYVGAPNSNVRLTISMSDKGDTELWRTCKTVKNVKTVEYWMQEGDVIYKKLRKICSCKEWTQVCFSPWEQGVVSRSINADFTVCDEKDAPIEMKDLTVRGCRDHIAHQYTLYTNPGDTRVLKLDTVRNQTITIFGEKNAQGQLLQTKMVHFTDYTENIGGNLRYFIGDDLLIRKVITKRDTITFNWDLKQQKVIVKVVASNGVFRVNKIIDLKEVLEYSQNPQNLHLRFKRKSSKKSKTAKKNVIVKQCQKPMNDIFLYTIVTKGKESAEVLGLRNEEKSGLYEVIFPKKKAPKKVTKICQKYTQVKSKECRNQAIIRRDRYKYVCNQMNTILANFSLSEVVDGFRLREACINAFRVDMKICRATTSSSKEGSPAYFTAACKTGENFKKEDLFSKIGKKFQMKLYARNDEAHETEQPEENIDVNKIEPFDTTILVMKDVMLDFIIIPNSRRLLQTYKMQIHHSCIDGDQSSIRITLKQTKRIIDEKKLCSGKQLMNKCLCCELEVKQSEDTVPPVVDEFIVTVTLKNSNIQKITFLSTFE